MKGPSNVVFLGARRPENHGTIHVHLINGDIFEACHESSSGNSWGSFEHFDNAQDAVAAGYRINRETYHGRCDVYAHPDVAARLPSSPSPLPPKVRF